MITKERLEEAIRGVISEFKRAKRIPDPVADDLFDQEASFSYTEVEDSVSYVEDLRDKAQLESAEGFLREIVAWQQMRSS